ncbi:MAG: spore cortex biosynthesis protein YabQ [bacterium]|nr:spore cortex biosynthesis protein YabQ [bacterium]
MSDAISMEVRFFVASILCGIILLIIYDVLRIFRRVIKHPWFFVALEDLIFWLLSGIVIFRMMYEMNNGTIRGFSVLGMFLGMIVYNKSLSPFFVKGISSLFILINKGILKVMFILSKPLRIISRYVKKMFAFLEKSVTKIGKLLRPLLKKFHKKSTIENIEDDNIQE